ncbi:MAG: aspartate--tRNA ligase [Desulfurococcales archaeon]|nr:aspartate--tRNA ligase [Desulfurococcales archaeon]
MDSISWRLKRTYKCGELRSKDAGKEVILNGWVHSIRKVGRVIFILLRDRSGIVQVVVTPKSQAFPAAKELDREFVIAVKGEVRLRPKNQVNPDMPTGEIEVAAHEIEVLNESKPLPLPIWDESLMSTTSEANRLRYRYLDLRREKVKNNILLRAKVVKAMRDFYTSKGFIEVETPYLGRSTPEGARDFLVPSRLHPRKFYALTQSPQLFKQLLMVAGLEKYFQVARCFRDEDPRADRQPEFTQFDMEISFVTREDVMSVVEESMKYVFREVLNIDLPTPFPRFTYEEAIERFGTDKPDLRFPSELHTLLEDGRLYLRYFKMKGLGKMCGTLQSKLKEAAKNFSLKGYGFRAVDLGSKECSEAMGVLPEDVKGVELEEGEGVVFAYGDFATASQFLGVLRNALGREAGIVKRNQYSFVWVTDFPLFEVDEETGRLISKHHPFTSPRPEDIPLLDKEPLKVKALSYDLVLNGYEVAGGSIRIHKRWLQEKMFSLMGLSKEEMIDRYGFLLEALEFGAPPHGGIAFGLDRLVAVMAGEDSIRDVIAFPKNKEMADPMTGSPAEAPPEYLKDLTWLKLT